MGCATVKGRVLSSLICDIVSQSDDFWCWNRVSSVEISVMWKTVNSMLVKPDSEPLSKFKGIYLSALFFFSPNHEIKIKYSQHTCKI